MMFEHRLLRLVIMVLWSISSTCHTRSATRKPMSLVSQASQEFKVNSSAALLTARDLKSCEAIRPNPSFIIFLPAVAHCTMSGMSIHQPSGFAAWFETGGRISWNVLVPQTGEYRMDYVVGRNPSGSIASAFRLCFGMTTPCSSSVSVPSTGGWYAGTTIIQEGLHFMGGYQTLSVEVLRTGWNLASVQLAPLFPVTTPLSTNAPTPSPSRSPEDLQISSAPANPSSRQPTPPPSNAPSARPSRNPTSMPSSYPNAQPSIEPSQKPSLSPSINPSEQPSNHPSHGPSIPPSQSPSGSPSFIPSQIPSSEPHQESNTLPTYQSSNSASPSTSPSETPISTILPSTDPTYHPSATRSDGPATSTAPSMMSRTPITTRVPSLEPGKLPANQPTKSGAPSRAPYQPTTASLAPFTEQTDQPTATPSMIYRGYSQTPTATKVPKKSHHPATSRPVTPLAQPTANPVTGGSSSFVPTALPILGTTAPVSAPVRQLSIHPIIVTRTPTIGGMLPIPSVQPVAASPISALPGLSPFSRPTRAPFPSPMTQTRDPAPVAPVTRPTSFPSWQTTLEPSLSTQPVVPTLTPPAAMPSLGGGSIPSTPTQSQSSSAPTVGTIIRSPSNPSTLGPMGSSTDQPALSPIYYAPSEESSGEPPDALHDRFPSPVPIERPNDAIADTTSTNKPEVSPVLTPAMASTENPTVSFPNMSPAMPTVLSDTSKPSLLSSGNMTSFGPNWPFRKATEPPWMEEILSPSTSRGESPRTVSPSLRSSAGRSKPPTNIPAPSASSTNSPLGSSQATAIAPTTLASTESDVGPTIVPSFSYLTKRVTLGVQVTLFGVDYLDDVAIEQWRVTTERWIEDYFNAFYESLLEGIRSNDAPQMRRLERRREARMIQVELEFVSQLASFHENGMPSNTISYVEIIYYSSRSALTVLNPALLRDAAFGDETALTQLEGQLREHIPALVGVSAPVVKAPQSRDSSGGALSPWATSGLLMGATGFAFATALLAYSWYLSRETK